MVKEFLKKIFGIGGLLLTGIGASIGNNTLIWVGIICSIIGLLLIIGLLK